MKMRRRRKFREKKSPEKQRSERAMESEKKQ